MTTVSVILTPAYFRVGASNIPTRVTVTGTNATWTDYQLAAGVRSDLYERFVIPSYGSGSLTLLLDWYSAAGSTSGNTVLGARIAAITPADSTGMEAKNWTTAATTTQAVNSNAKGLTRTSITISALDSLASLDEIWVNAYRDGTSGSDTMSGALVLTSALLQYSDT